MLQHPDCLWSPRSRSMSTRSSRRFAPSPTPAKRPRHAVRATRGSTPSTASAANPFSPSAEVDWRGLKKDQVVFVAEGHDTTARLVFGSTRGYSWTGGDSVKVLTVEEDRVTVRPLGTSGNSASIGILFDPRPASSPAASPLEPPPASAAAAASPGEEEDEWDTGRKRGRDPDVQAKHVYKLYIKHRCNVDVTIEAPSGVHVAHPWMETTPSLAVPRCAATGAATDPVE